MASPARRRPRWLLPLGAGLTIVLVALVAVVATMALRPAPAARAPAASSHAPAASPAPQASPSSTAPGEDQRRYRTYVSTFVVHSTAIAAAFGSLQDCREDRPRCHVRLVEARARVEAYQQQLDANPAPSCLGAADQRLHDGLAFEAQGLQLAQSAIDSRERVALAQGLALLMAGVWREGQAVVAARNSNC
jgi:hypothetical protein